MEILGAIIFVHLDKESGIGTGLESESKPIGSNVRFYYEVFSQIERLPRRVFDEHLC